MSLRDTMLAAIAANGAFAVRVDAKKSSDEEILAVYNEMLAGGAKPADDRPAATDAAKYFRGIEVQTARRVTVKGDDGIERPAYDVEMVKLTPEHILSTRRYPDGRVAVVTIDGRRHVANGARA